MIKECRRKGDIAEEIDERVEEYAEDCVYDRIKKQADTLFSSLGLNTSTAIRIFLNAAIEHSGIPFSVQYKAIPHSLQEAVYDSRFRRNLNGFFEYE